MKNPMCYKYNSSFAGHYDTYVRINSIPFKQGRRNLILEEILLLYLQLLLSIARYFNY